MTRTPALVDVRPLWKRCRSSGCCLEWETHLGAEMPFRRAQEALRFFTYRAVEQQDTTIAARIVDALIDEGVLPRDVDYGGGLVSQVVVWSLMAVPGSSSTWSRSCLGLILDFLWSLVYLATP